MTELINKSCEPCRAGAPGLEDSKIEEYMKNVPEWEVLYDESEGGMKKLKRKYSLKNFREAIDFADAVGEAAEENGHHPAMLVEYGALTVWWWTHKIGGLHENDFIMAAKTDALFAGKA